MRNSLGFENDIMMDSRSKYDLYDNSYSRKVNFYQNNSIFPYYAMLQKLVGPKAASFYFKCDSIESDIQSTYQSLLNRCLELEDRYRKVQEIVNFENSDLEKEEEALLKQTESNIANIKKLIKSMKQNEEYIKREYAYISNLEFENQNRSKCLELFAAKIEQERFEQFENSYSKFASDYNNIKNNSQSKNRQETNKFKVSFNKEKIQKVRDVLKKKEQLYLSQIQNIKDQENQILKQKEISEKLYVQKMQKIQQLKSNLANTEALKKELNFGKAYSKELNNTLSNLQRRRNDLSNNTFNFEKEKQQLMETRQMLNENEHLLERRKQEINEKQRLLDIKIDQKKELMKQIEMAENEMKQKEKLVIRLNQQILENAMKFDDVLYNSQNELEYMTIFANKTSPRDTYNPSDELYDILNSNNI